MEPSLAPRRVFDGRSQGDQWEISPHIQAFETWKPFAFPEKRGKNGGPWALRLAAKVSLAIQDWVDAWRKGL